MCDDLFGVSSRGSHRFYQLLFGLSYRSRATGRCADYNDDYDDDPEMIRVEFLGSASYVQVVDIR